MSTDFVHIKNKHGMTALCDGAALTNDRRIVYLSVIGAQTAVKAIWASVVARRPVYIRYCQACGEEGVDYVVLKYVLAQNVHRWVMFPNPSSDAPYLPLLPLCGMDAPALLPHLLNQHTIWPAKQVWGKVLMTRGLKAGLVKECQSFGIPWAYTVCPTGWDEVIDAAARAGELTFKGGEQ